MREIISRFRNQATDAASTALFHRCLNAPLCAPERRSDLFICTPGPLGGEPDTNNPTRGERSQQSILVHTIPVAGTSLRSLALYSSPLVVACCHCLLQKRPAWKALVYVGSVSSRFSPARGSANRSPWKWQQSFFHCVLVVLLGLGGKGLARRQLTTARDAYSRQLTQANTSPSTCSIAQIRSTPMPRKPSREGSSGRTSYRTGC